MRLTPLLALLLIPLPMMADSLSNEGMRRLAQDQLRQELTQDALRMPEPPTRFDSDVRAAQRALSTESDPDLSHSRFLRPPSPSATVVLQEQLHLFDALSSIASAINYHLRFDPDIDASQVISFKGRSQWSIDDVKDAVETQAGVHVVQFNDARLIMVLPELIHERTRRGLNQ